MVYLPTYIWLIFMVNVGKYTSPVDPMRYELTEPTSKRRWFTPELVMTWSGKPPNFPGFSAN